VRLHGLSSLVIKAGKGLARFVSRLSGASLQTQINQARAVGILPAIISANNLFSQ
jgi:hypothetical protein